MPSKHWKCRACEGYNPKSVGQCGWCGSQYQLLMQEASTKENPIMSQDHVAPGGYGYASKGGNYGKGYGGKQGGGWYQPGHMWPAAPSMHGPYHYAPATYGGKGAYAYGKGKGGKGKGGFEGTIKPLKDGDASPSGAEETDASMYGSSSSARSAKSNAWQKRVDRRKLMKEQAAAERRLEPALLPRRWRQSPQTQYRAMQIRDLSFQRVDCHLVSKFRVTK